jgi:ornithine cyclodeaminase
MSQPSPLWISEADVVAMMEITQAIAALETGLLAEAQGYARNMVKTHVGWGEGATLHAIGAVFPNEALAGTKTWTHTTGGATPLLVLFDSNDGSLKAIIEAFALGQLRTAAASGVATDRLAAKDANDFAIIGTGKQALAQVAAVMAVRPIKRVRVFGPNEDRRKQFAKRVSDEFGVAAIAAESIAEAVAGASIVTVVTRATDPIITSEIIAAGAHINAIGAIIPSRAEIARDVLERCSQIIVDSVSAAQKLSRELMDFFSAAEKEDWNRVRSLADIVAIGETRGRSDDVTLFKSLGMGISDLALGIELYRKARAAGRGREFPHPQRAMPRLRTVERSETNGLQIRQSHGS